MNVRAIDIYPTSSTGGLFMTDRYPLTLPFRGGRSYLHGTDIYLAIKEVVSQSGESPFAISFHSLLEKQPDLLICSDEGLRKWRSDLAFRGEVRIGSGSERINAVILESNRVVNDRKDCNEEVVVGGANIIDGQKSATLDGSGVGVSIEKVVFLNKWLHLRLLPDMSPKWLFARLELISPLADVFSGELRVQVEQILGGRFTRSGIFLNNERIGAISFSTPK